MSVSVFDDRRCQLGEGPLWHPERKQLFWFDILAYRMLSRDASGPLAWQFEEPVSAAGWVDADNLLIASASGLLRFNLSDGSTSRISPLEKLSPRTRSNDGRADPWGGFWIGTMGRAAEPGAGAVYRLYQGRLRRLFGGITIPNAICFAPGKGTAYFADTAEAQIMQVPLDRNGWPAGPATCLIDLSEDGLNPDGAVVDQNGTLWVAQWGAGRVAAYSAAGEFERAVALPAHHTTCPAFGGEDLQTLFVTSALQGLAPGPLATQPAQGQTFALPGVAQGLAEPKVIL